MHAVLKALCLGCSLSVAALSPLLASAGEDGSGPSTAGPAVSNPTTGDQPSQHRPAISLSGGRMSAGFKNLPVGQLAEELSHKAGVVVVVSPDCAGQVVSANFHNLPVDEGLRRILQTQDAFFFYGADQGKPSSLKVVWVYPKGKGNGLAPVPPEQWGSTRELEGKLTASDPAVRGRAIETLVQRKGAAATDAVLKALTDKDATVRQRALYASMQGGVQLPPAVLSEMTGDSSADVRFLALHALAGTNSPDAAAVAERLAADSNEAVRNEAQVIISRLNPPPQSAAPSEKSPQDSQQANQSPEAGR